MNNIKVWEPSKLEVFVGGRQLLGLAEDGLSFSDPFTYLSVTCFALADNPLVVEDRYNVLVLSCDDRFSANGNLDLIRKSFFIEGGVPYVKFVFGE